MSLEDLNDAGTEPVLSRASVAPPIPPPIPPQPTQASLPKKRYKKPAYLNTMSEAEKDANLKVIENMNKRLNYLRNPRYKEDKATILMSTVSLCNSVSGSGPY
jgi:hypothetical protein